MPRDGERDQARHVGVRSAAAGLLPQGPSSEDLDHDDLWRSVRPCRTGRIGSSTVPIMKRSSSSGSTAQLLEYQKVPRDCSREGSVEGRGRDIWNLEDHLSTARWNGSSFSTSPKDRASASATARQAREDWKFWAADPRERDHWNEYQEAHQDMIRGPRRRPRRRTSFRRQQWFTASSCRRSSTPWRSKLESPGLEEPATGDRPREGGPWRRLLQRGARRAAKG